MKAKMEIMGNEGQYYARATGENVTVGAIDIVYGGDNGKDDLWRAIGQDNGRRIAIDRNELSWLSNGQWNAYPYSLVTL